MAQAESFKLPEDVFIQRAIKKHGDKYDYSELNYSGITTKVTIGCTKHGKFTQMPYAHTRGQGCPHCSYESCVGGWTRTAFKDKCDQNNNGQGILYILHCFNDNESFYKIGITSRSVQKRYKGITSMPYAYRIIDEVIGDPEYIYDLEKTLHRDNKEQQYKPLINFCGSTECFSVLTD